MMSQVKISAILISALAHQAASLYNGLAITPQMGWNNWNSFGCDLDEDLILGSAKIIADYGLRDLGYNYINMDDCWQASRERGSDGKIHPNATKFPNGMKEVSDRIHALGFKFGMYSTAGSLTCAKYAASLGHEEVDAQQFADWGVDLLKYDNCFNEGQSGTPLITYERYKKMGDALNKTGRPILYSMCNWGEDYPWKWAQTVANSWRMSGDIEDTFSRPDPRCPCVGNEGFNCALAGFHCSAMNILHKVSFYVDKGIPGAWNDLDSLEVGNGGMTDAEYKAHFSMWAAVKSPLVMGHDVRKTDAATLSILSNAAVIAINQDPAGSSAVRRWIYPVDDVDEYGQGDIQLWSGSLEGGDYVVALLNTGTKPRAMNATLRDIFVDEGPYRTAEEPNSSWDVYDLWANRMSNQTATAILNGNGTAPINSTSTYNATKTSYKDGLANKDPRLLGAKTTTLPPRGTLTAEVEPHGIGFFRLRKNGNQMSRMSDL